MDVCRIMRIDRRKQASFGVGCLNIEHFAEAPFFDNLDERGAVFDSSVGQFENGPRPFHVPERIVYAYGDLPLSIGIEQLNQIHVCPPGMYQAKQTQLDFILDSGGDFEKYYNTIILM
jgi:hypothetical protein